MLPLNGMLGTMKKQFVFVCVFNAQSRKTMEDTMCHGAARVGRVKFPFSVSFQVIRLLRIHVHGGALRCVWASAEARFTSEMSQFYLKTIVSIQSTNYE